MDELNPDARDATYKALAQDGLVLMEANRIKTSKLWRAALARAALSISEQGNKNSAEDKNSSGDFRLPIVMALMTLYQEQHHHQSLSEDDMSARVEALLALEVDYLQSLLQTVH